MSLKFVIYLKEFTSSIFSAVNADVSKNKNPFALANFSPSSNLTILLYLYSLLNYLKIYSDSLSFLFPTNVITIELLPYSYTSSSHF